MGLCFTVFHNPDLQIHSSVFNFKNYLSSQTKIWHPLLHSDSLSKAAVAGIPERWQMWVDHYQPLSPEMNRKLNQTNLIPRLHSSGLVGQQKSMGGRSLAFLCQFCQQMTNNYDVMNRLCKKKRNLGKCHGHTDLEDLLLIFDSL